MSEELDALKDKAIREMRLEIEAMEGVVEAAKGLSLPIDAKPWFAFKAALSRLEELRKANLKSEKR